MDNQRPLGPPPSWRPPPPQAPPTRRRGRAVAIAAGITLCVAVIAAVVVVVAADDDEPGQDDVPTATGTESGAAASTDEPDPPTTSEDPAEEAEPEEPAFRDWLAPDKTLQVGKERYVSPCQVLSLDDVREIYGEPPSGTAISEEFLDVSVRDRVYPATAYDTSCRYGDLVTLDAGQDNSRRELRHNGIDAALQSYRSEETPAKVKRYRKAVAGSDDSALKEFVDELVDVSRLYARYSKKYDPDILDGLDFDTVVQASGQSGFSFLFFVDNVSYTLTQEQGGDTDELRDFGDSFVLRQLEQAMAAIARIRERAADPTLSQSPAPTIPATGDTYGRTRLLEPCAVLSRSVFEDLTGRPDNVPVARQSLPVQLPGLPPSWDSSSSVVTNGCDRTSRREKGNGGSDEAMMRISIDYARTARQAMASLRRGGYLPLARGDARLDTRADIALETTDDIFDVTLYTFLVGPYQVTVTWSGLATESLLGEITSTEATREEYVTAINALTRSLRRHLAKADRTDGR